MLKFEIDTEQGKDSYAKKTLVFYIFLAYVLQVHHNVSY